MMRIAYYSPGWPAQRAQNGIATYVDMMTRALRAADVDSVILTPNVLESGHQADVYPVTLPQPGPAQRLLRHLRRRLGAPPAYDVKSAPAGVARAASRAAEDGAIDVLEMEESFGYAAHLQTLAPMPVCIRIHGPHFLVHQGVKDRRYELRCDAEGEALRKGLAISCPSQAVLNAVKAQYGVSARVEAVIPNPVDIPDGDDCWRFEDCDSNLILFIGRFDAIKGADILLEAFAQVAASNLNVKLVMAGKDNGLTKADGRIAQFNDYAASVLPSSLLARVRFLGPISREDVDQWRRKAFLCVSASRYETFPYAVSEALVLGCPVIATATPGLNEYFTAGEDLMLTDVGDSAMLAQAITTLLKSPERAISLGAKARAAAVDKLSPRRVAQQSLDFYRETINAYSCFKSS